MSGGYLGYGPGVKDLGRHGRAFWGLPGGAPDGNLQAGTVDGSTGLKTKISDQRDKEIDPTVAKRPQY